MYHYYNILFLFHSLFFHLNILLQILMYHYNYILFHSIFFHLNILLQILIDLHNNILFFFHFFSNLNILLQILSSHQYHILLPFLLFPFVVKVLDKLLFSLLFFSFISIFDFPFGVLTFLSCLSPDEGLFTK